MAQIFKVDSDFDFNLLEGSSCAFGVFDGVHVGHRYLIDQAIATAHESGGVSIALTFDIDPDERFHPERLKKLLSNDDRISMIAAMGVDIVAVLPFTKKFSSKDPNDFLDSVFGGTVPSYLHVGSGFRFGSKASGTIEQLQDWSRTSGCSVCEHDLVFVDGAPVTATRIRLLLAEGNVREAARLLTYPYTLHDRVVAGRGEGRNMGFRTANLMVDPMLRVLSEGVYAAYALVDGRKYRAAVSVGVSPTFKGVTDSYSEVHILDFEGDIYDDEIRVQFVEWLRPMIEFSSVDELVATVMGNIEWVRANL